MTHVRVTQGQGLTSTYAITVLPAPAVPLLTKHAIRALRFEHTDSTTPERFNLALGPLPLGPLNKMRILQNPGPCALCSVFKDFCVSISEMDWRYPIQNPLGFFVSVELLEN